MKTIKSRDHTVISFAICVCFLSAITLSSNSIAGTSDPNEPIVGSAELHSHLMAEHMFGGSWFWGTVEGNIEYALRRCEGNFNVHDHAAFTVPLIAEMLGGDDTGTHLGKRRGYDRRTGIGFPREHFEHWPSPRSKAHQQMWWGHLKMAYDKGLKFMVVSFTESYFLCSQTPEEMRRYDCNEMASVKRQAKFIRGFVSRNKDWVGIAETPRQARELISRGKLALMLAVEVTELFPEGDYIEELDELYDLGIRSVMLAHHADSKFAGTAPLPQIVNAAKTYKRLFGDDFGQIDDVKCTVGGLVGAKEGDCDGDIYLNPVGLTLLGRNLVRAMVERGMVVDVAHTSRKTVNDVYDELVVDKGDRIVAPIPMFNSHAHMGATMHSSVENTEKFVRPHELDLIKNLNGMIGLRTGPDRAIHYSPDVAVKPNCPGSVRDFAQSLIYVISEHGINMGFGADIQGFIEQMNPQHGDCEDIGGGDFQRKGLAHIGLLPDIIPSLKRIGTPEKYTKNLESSAENFIKLWERSWRGRKHTGVIRDTHLLSNRDEWVYYKLDVASNATKVIAELKQGSYGKGDADLYVRLGDYPSKDQFDCVSKSYASSEACTLNLSDHDWQGESVYVGVYAYSTYNNVRKITVEASMPNLHVENVTVVNDNWYKQRDWSSWVYHKIEPEQSYNGKLKVYLGGDGTGEADLYIQQGKLPTENSYSCRGVSTGNNDFCVIKTQGLPGPWYVGVQTYNNVRGLTLRSTFTSNAHFQKNEISAKEGEWQHYYVYLPSGYEGARRLNVTLTGDNGDADLYIGHIPTFPTLDEYECRGFRSGSNERCVTPYTTEIWGYMVSVRAYKDFKNLSLKASYEYQNGVTIPANMTVPADTTSGAIGGALP